MGCQVTVNCDRRGCVANVFTVNPAPYGGIDGWLESSGWGTPRSKGEYVCRGCQNGHPREQIKLVEGADLLKDFLGNLAAGGFYMTDCPNQSDSRSVLHEEDCAWHVYDAENPFDEGPRAQILQSGHSYRARVLGEDGTVLIDEEDEVWW